MQGFFITGTGTEIGKTFIAALLSRGLHEKGISVCPVKPIASGGVLLGDDLISEDAHVYRCLAGVDEPLSTLNPFCLKRPVSPHFAAEIEMTPIPFDDIDCALSRLAQQYDALLIEGIGGWLVPLSYETTVADYAARLKLPVIIVSANVLGTLNHTLLTIEAIRKRNVELAGVIVTGPTPDMEPDMAENNVETIRRMGRVEILGDVPYVEDCEAKDAPTIWNEVKDAFRWERILELLHTAKNR